MDSISSKKMDELLGYVVMETPDHVRDLLKQNGVDANHLQGNDLSVAFLKAIKDSDHFRSEVADYLTGMIQHETGNGRMNFISAKAMKSVGNFNAIGYSASSDPAAGAGATTTATPSIASGGGSFWSNLGSSQNINSVLNSGLNVLSTSLINKSNKASEDRALQAKALDLQIAQANAAAKAQESVTKPGMPGWAWALIILGIVGAITLITVTVIKNKKRRAASAA